MEKQLRLDRLIRNPTRQANRINKNIKEIREIYAEIETNPQSPYQKIKLDTEIIKIIKLLELERQIIEFDRILQETRSSSQNLSNEENSDNSQINDKLDVYEFKE